MNLFLWQKLLLAYWAAASLFAFVLMGIDKRRAVRHAWRIPEAALFASALLGGSLGAIAGMHFFRHKTKHWYFVVGMPLIFAAQLALAGFLALRLYRP